MSLKPLAVWAVLALFSAGAAVLVALFGPVRPPSVLEALADDGSVDTAQLVLLVERLMGENQQLGQRLAGLERKIGDVAAAPPSGAGQARVASLVPQEAAPATLPGVEPVQTLRFAAPNGRAATQTPAMVARAEGGAPAPRPDFAVDLGADTALDGLRLRWAALTSKHQGLFDGLEPRVGMREGNDGTAELRLIVGPLATAEAAARICAALAGQGATCQSAIYGGQRLSLR